MYIRCQYVFESFIVCLHFPSVLTNVVWLAQRRPQQHQKQPGCFWKERETRSLCAHIAKRRPEFRPRWLAQLFYTATGRRDDSLRARWDGWWLGQAREISPPPCLLGAGFTQPRSGRPRKCPATKGQSRPVAKWQSFRQKSAKPTAPSQSVRPEWRPPQRSPINGAVTS